MQTRFFVQLSAAAIISLCGVGNLMAISVQPASVQETPAAGGTTQYTVNNTSSTVSAGGKFDIGVLLVTTNGSNPTTTNANWIGETVNATSWEQNMGTVAGTEPITWHQFTGMTFLQAFPSNPVDVNGYYLKFTESAGLISYPGSPVAPGSSLGNFTFTGSPSSTFFVAGPTDGVSSFAPGAVVTYSSSTIELPEPASISAALTALALCTCRRRHR